LRSRVRWLRRNLHEPQSLALICDAAGATMSTTTAPCWTRTSCSLLLLDDRLVDSEGRYEQHNDCHVQQQRQQCTRPAILSRTRQRQRRKLSAAHERRAR
jgi:hypothetical protein